MVATVDIRLGRDNYEYMGLRDAQDALMDRIDTYEEAILGLSQAVAANRELIMANHELTQRQIAELHRMMEAMMQHLEVPYKPPAGFVKE